MHWPSGRRRRRERKDQNSPSPLQIYHHIPFPINDLLEVLHPLFGAYYPYNEFLHMVQTVNHVFCAYDPIQKLCVACALLNNTSDNVGLYVMLFGVRSTSQNQGTGTRLLQAVIDWARQAGYRYIYLDVHVDNYKAAGLYEKVGFRKYTYLPNYYIHTSKRPPHAIRMILSLS